MEILRDCLSLIFPVEIKGVTESFERDIALPTPEQTVQSVALIVDALNDRTVGF